MESEILHKLVKRWVFAADKNIPDSEEMTFRSSEAEIPITRGKRVMEFKKNGHVIIQEVGPDDRPVYSEGNFTLENPDIIKVMLENSKSPKLMIIKIISLTEDMLTVKVQR